MKTAFAFLLSLGVVSSASAMPITYTLDVGAGTLHHNSVTVAILEAGGGQTSFDFGYTLNTTGQTTITHDVSFLPTSSLILALDLPGSTGDSKTHVVVFANPDFAQSHLGVRFDVSFPNTGYNAFIARLASAENGDLEQQAWLMNFFTTGSGAPAAFATDGPSSGIEFSVALPLTPVPEPASLVLLGTGLLAAGAIRRRRTRSHR